MQLTTDNQPNEIGTQEDFTNDKPKLLESISPQVDEAPYDPREQEDNARRIIAYLLIGLLFISVIGVFILLGCQIINVADLSEFGVIFSPIIALVSAATGFYYGTKSNS